VEVGPDPASYVFLGLLLISLGACLSLPWPDLHSAVSSVLLSWGVILSVDGAYRLRRPWWRRKGLALLSAGVLLLSAGASRWVGVGSIPAGAGLLSILYFFLHPSRGGRRFPSRSS